MIETLNEQKLETSIYEIKNYNNSIICIYHTGKLYEGTKWRVLMRTKQ